MVSSEPRGCQQSARHVEAMSPLDRLVGIRRHSTVAVGGTGLEKFERALATDFADQVDRLALRWRLLVGDPLNRFTNFLVPRGLLHRLHLDDVNLLRAIEAEERGLSDLRH